MKEDCVNTDADENAEIAKLWAAEIKRMWFWFFVIVVCFAALVFAYCIAWDFFAEQLLKQRIISALLWFKETLKAVLATFNIDASHLLE